MREIVRIKIDNIEEKIALDSKIRELNIRHKNRGNISWYIIFSVFKLKGCKMDIEWIDTTNEFNYKSGYYSLNQEISVNDFLNERWEKINFIPD